MTKEETIIMNKKKLHPDRILDYFREEWKVLALITVSGLIYNLGQIHQAVLCAPVCQQCEQENEEDPLPDAGT
mgnify:CR=1 FL=1